MCGQRCWMWVSQCKPITLGVKLYSVQRGISEWLTERGCGMQARLCLRLGVSLPFLQKSKAPHNKVDELACSWVCCEIKVCTCYPATLALPDGPQKTPSTDQRSVIKALTPSVCVIQTSAFGNVRIQGEKRHISKTRPALSIWSFHREKK